MDVRSEPREHTHHSHDVRAARRMRKQRVFPNEIARSSHAQLLSTDSSTGLGSRAVDKYAAAHCHVARAEEDLERCEVGVRCEAGGGRRKVRGGKQEVWRWETRWARSAVRA